MLLSNFLLFAHGCTARRDKRLQNEAVEAAGVQINEIADKTPFQDAMAPVYEAYLAANPDLRPLVEMIQATE